MVPLRALPLPSSVITCKPRLSSEQLVLLRGPLQPFLAPASLAPEPDARGCSQEDTRSRIGAEGGPPSELGGVAQSRCGTCSADRKKGTQFLSCQHTVLLDLRSSPVSGRTGKTCLGWLGDFFCDTRPPVKWELPRAAHNGHQLTLTPPYTGDIHAVC